MVASYVFRLASFPVHLALGSRVVVQPEFRGTLDWYRDYGTRHASDGVEGRLVSLHTFDAPWQSWEMHPLGDELVVCVSGSIVLHQEIDGAVRSATLGPGDAIVNPAGVWHTADVDAPATAFFVTAGAGTEIRAR
ncbi:MAG: cupin domain-containing protein [Planctomycetes bacterium]|nr:cupin domain-containing protein [Planctomycetota bacterium]